MLGEGKTNFETDLEIYNYWKVIFLWTFFHHLDFLLPEKLFQPVFFFANTFSCIKILNKNWGISETVWKVLI